MGAVIDLLSSRLIEPKINNNPYCSLILICTAFLYRDDAELDPYPDPRGKHGPYLVPQLLLHFESIAMDGCG